MCRRGTRACAHHLDLNIRIFHMLFLLSKASNCMHISAYSLVKIDVFLKVPHFSWAHNFVNMYLTHLETRI
jgi:hypothetical protein